MAASWAHPRRKGVWSGSLVVRSEMGAEWQSGARSPVAGIHALRIPPCLHARSLQSCLTLWDPMGCNLPGSTVHGILQARILEWVATPSFGGSSQPRDRTPPCLLCLLRWQVSSLPLVLPGKGSLWGSCKERKHMLLKRFSFRTPPQRVLTRKRAWPKRNPFFSFL